MISIHTPVKGVTVMSSFNFKKFENFNPHTREGCDLIYQICLCICFYFNPHTREGCDFATVTTPARAAAFQSTHP